MDTAGMIDVVTLSKKTIYLFYNQILIVIFMQ